MTGLTKSATYSIRALSNFRGYSTSSLSSGVDIRFKKHQPVARYCGRDKGMPNDWSLSWESMATREREREPRDAPCGKLPCCLYVGVVAPHDRCQKTAPVPHKGLMANW